MGSPMPESLNSIRGLQASYIPDYQLTDEDINSEVNQFKDKIRDTFLNKPDVNGALYVKVEGETTVGEIKFTTDSKCNFAWISEDLNSASSESFAPKGASKDDTSCHLVTVVTEDRKVNFQIPMTCVVADIQSLLRNRFVGGLLEELRDQNGKSIWKRSKDASFMTDQLNTILSGYKNDRIVAKMGEDDKEWLNLKLQFPNNSVVVQTVRVTDAVHDVIRRLERERDVGRIHTRSGNLIYQSGEDEDISRSRRTFEELDISDNEEFRVEFNRDAPLREIASQSQPSRNDDDDDDEDGDDTDCDVEIFSNVRNDLHCVIENLRRKRPFRSNDQLHSVMCSFVNQLDKKETEGEIFDIRIKSKSLYKVAGPSVRSWGNKTLKECNLHKGDTVEVIYRSMRRACCGYRGKLVHLDYEQPEDLDHFKVDRGDENFDVKSKLIERSNFDFPADKCYLFEFKLQTCQTRRCRLYRPLYDKDRPPALNDHKRASDVNKTDEDIEMEEEKHCYHLWADCEYIDIEKKAVISDDLSWPWGESEHKYWMYGIKMTNGKCKENADYKIRYFIFIESGYLVDMTPKADNTVRTIRELKRSSSIPIDRTERKLSRFIGFVREDANLSLNVPQNSILTIFERVDSKHFDTEEENIKHYGEILKSGEYWINCAPEQAKNLTNRWRTV